MQDRVVYERMLKARHILQNLRPESKSTIALQGDTLCCSDEKVRDQTVGYVGDAEFSSSPRAMWKFQS